MIKVKIIGGLGNQMFQLAFAYVLSRKTKDNKILVDRSVYSKYKVRAYAADNLVISSKMVDFSEADISYIREKHIRIREKCYHVFQYIIKKMGIEESKRLCQRRMRKGYYHYFGTNYVSVPEESTSFKAIYGYFQSEKYFEEYKKDIATLMKVKTKLTNEEEDMLKLIKNTEAVAISLRLQDDYVMNKELNVCNEQYFIDGINTIKEKVNNPVFYIFADDIERAKKINFGIDAIYIEGFKDYEGLRLMYNCKHYVISNSSFSWWGAYLCDYDKKIVIAPKKWMNSKYTTFRDIHTKDMLLI